MRPKRLVFGAKFSQNLFNEAVYLIFGDMLRCLNQRDDIPLGGGDREKHTKTLQAILQKALEVESSQEASKPVERPVLREQQIMPTASRP